MGDTVKGQSPKTENQFSVLKGSSSNTQGEDKQKIPSSSTPGILVAPILVEKR